MATFSFSHVSAKDSQQFGADDGVEQRRSCAGVSVEHTCKAIARCSDFDRSQAIRDVLREHDRTLKDFERLRQRLQSDASLD